MFPSPDAYVPEADFATGWSLLVLATVKLKLGFSLTFTYSSAINWHSTVNPSLLKLLYPVFNLCVLNS
jgi:hypothetical protein